MDIGLYDLFARKVAVLHQGYETEGEYQKRITLPQVSGRIPSAGVYYLYLNAGGHKTATKVILVH